MRAKVAMSVLGVAALGCALVSFLVSAWWIHKAAVAPPTWDGFAQSREGTEQALEWMTTALLSMFVGILAWWSSTSFEGEDFAAAVGFGVAALVVMGATAVTWPVSPSNVATGSQEQAGANTAAARLQEHYNAWMQSICDTRAAVQKVEDSMSNRTLERVEANAETATCYGNISVAARQQAEIKLGLLCTWIISKEAPNAGRTEANLKAMWCQSGCPPPYHDNSTPTHCYHVHGLDVYTRLGSLCGAVARADEGPEAAAEDQTRAVLWCAAGCPPPFNQDDAARCEQYLTDPEATWRH